MEDYTMKRILAALEDPKMIEEFIDNISKPSSDTKEIVPVSIPPASVNTTPSETISKKYQKVRKKARLKANQIAKKSAVRKLKDHTKFLGQMSMYDE